MQWFKGIFHRRQLFDDLSEEMRLHIEERVEQLVREGLSPQEAQRQARLAFGNLDQVEQRSREVWQWPALESIWSDLRIAMRSLRRSPGFAIAAILTLALAIGANSVVFGVLNALILRPLNVPDSKSLYTLERGGYKEQSTSWPDYVDLRDRNRTFDGLTAYILTQIALDTGGSPDQVWGYEVASNYFDALKVQPYLGHFFHLSDEHGDASAPYLVLSYAYWHTHFQDDRNIVGRVVQVNRRPYTILGVAPPDFRGTLLFVYPAFFVPMINRGPNFLHNRGQRDIFMVLGHTRPGVTPAQAIADLDSIGSYLEKTYPKNDAWMTYSLARPSLVGDMLGPAVKGFMTGMMLLSGLILLAACSNLGSLFAARAADRSREVALRLALGSSRRRILRAVLTEAVLLSFVGGVIGFAGSVLLLRRLSVWQPIPQYPMHVAVYPDASVCLVALLLALASGFLFGLAPVRQILRTSPYEVIKAGSSGIIPGRTRFTLRDVLLVLQIAICAVLVTSSLVAVRGLVRSMHSRFGFDPKDAMLVDTTLSMAGYAPDRVPAMQKRMIDALKTIPGVTTVGFVSQTPLCGGAGTADVFTQQTTDLKTSNAAANVMVYEVSPEYFRAAGTSLLAGRNFTWADDARSPRVAIVNALFARRLFGSVANAIGGRYKTEDGTLVQVVGIVENGKYYLMTEDPKPAMFMPFMQSPTGMTTLVVRSGRDPQQLAADIRTTLHGLDNSLPLYLQTWTQGLSIALFPPRVATVALGVLGIMGAMLSITGIFGMAAYSVSRRLKELGIRIALGAQRPQLLNTALGRAVRLLAIGSCAGLALGILASRVLASIVYQATSRDPLVLAGVVFAMALLGLVATWLPAQRALSVDPLALLREE